MTIYLGPALLQASVGLPDGVPAFRRSRNGPFPLSLPIRLAFLHVEIAAFHPFGAFRFSTELAQGFAPSNKSKDLS